MTLNQIAERVASLVNQPFNHDLKERIKDMIKNVYATRIRQSSERHGIDELLKLQLILDVEEIEERDLLEKPHRILSGKDHLYKTTLKVPTPIRIHNDAPFTFVGDMRGKPFIYATKHESVYRCTSFPTGGVTSYRLLNGHIVIHVPRVFHNDPFENGNPTEDRNILDEILVEGIFENPENVLGMYLDVDEQDIELPFPNDMLESIIAEILQVEFNVYPDDTDVRANQQVTQANG